MRLMGGAWGEGEHGPKGVTPSPPYAVREAGGSMAGNDRLNVSAIDTFSH